MEEQPKGRTHFSFDSTHSTNLSPDLLPSATVWIFTLSPISPWMPGIVCLMAQVNGEFT